VCLPPRPEVERIRPPEGKINILYASSDYGPVVHSGTLWHDTYIIPEIERLGYRDKHLRDPMAQRPAYNMLLESDFTTGCGHGGETVYTGGLQQPLLELGKRKYDEGAIQGMSFKYLSCLLGAKLLPQLVEDGARLAQGYEKSYAFSWSPQFAFTKPENDPILRSFFSYLMSNLSSHCSTEQVTAVLLKLRSKATLETLKGLKTPKLEIFLFASKILWLCLETLMPQFWTRFIVSLLGNSRIFRRLY